MKFTKAEIPYRLSDSQKLFKHDLSTFISPLSLLILS